MGNIIKDINTWAVPAVQYSVCIIDWAQAELDILDKKNTKKINDHAFHIGGEIGRFYFARSKSGRELLQVEHTRVEEKYGLNDYNRHKKSTTGRSL